GGHFLAGPNDPDHLGAHALNGDVEGLEYARSKSFLLAQEAKEDVLGTDVVVLEDSGLLLGEDDHLASPFGEALKHGCALLSVGNYGGDVTRSFPLDRHIRRSPERCQISTTRSAESTNASATTFALHEA